MPKLTDQNPSSDFAETDTQLRRNMPVDAYADLAVLDGEGEQ